MPFFWPQSQGTVWDGGKGTASCSVLLPLGRLTQRLRVTVLTKVRVARDPKKQVMITLSTNSSRRLDQM